jgi:uncharacterized membrane protein YkvA (DUF1232 family)
MADRANAARKNVAKAGTKPAAPTKAAAKTPAKRGTSTSKKAAAKKRPTTTKATAKKAAAKRAPAKAPGSRPTGKRVRAAKAGTSGSTANKEAASAAKSRFFLAALRRAGKLKGKERDLLSLADAAEKKSQKLKSGAGPEALGDLKGLLRLVRAYAKRDYRAVSWDSMVLIIAGIIYVVNPLDVIPDTIPGLGFLDDAAVIGFVLKIVRDELDEFLEWETPNRL